MQSTVKPKPTDDPHDFLVVPPMPFGRAREEELSDLLRAAARQQADPQIHAESGSAAAPPCHLSPTFRLGRQRCPRLGRRAVDRKADGSRLRRVAAGSVHRCHGRWLQAFGYAGKKLIVKWTPQFVLTSLSMDKWGLSAPSSSPSIEASASDASQPAALAASEPGSRRGERRLPVSRLGAVAAVDGLATSRASRKRSSNSRPASSSSRRASCKCPRRGQASESKASESQGF